MKTGTTALAGRCLVSGAESPGPAGDSVIVVVLGAADEDDRYGDSALLLDHGLEVLAHRRLVNVGPGGYPEVALKSSL